MCSAPPRGRRRPPPGRGSARQHRQQLCQPSAYASARAESGGENAEASTPGGGFMSATGGPSLTPYSYGSDSTTGTTVKLSASGGEEVCHSRPREFHGLPTSRSLVTTVDQTKLITKSRIDPPRKNEEIETQSFSVCRLCWYSNTRRGCPASPIANSGRNVELNAMNISQKCHLPSVWFSLMPSIFGSQ